jgi:enoyl-CoA hydratase
MSMVLVEDGAGFRRLRLNRPEKLNALSPALLDELTAALDAAMADDDVRAVVLSGEGRAFSAGADTRAESSEFRARLKDAPVDMAATQRRVDEWLRLKSLPKPVIAQVHGYCLGLANELVGCADLVVCGESARFGMPEVREIGLFPTLGFWPERVGVQRTMELVLTGRLVDGDEAARIGLALACWPDGDLRDAVDALASSIAAVDSGRLLVTKAAVSSWTEAAGQHLAARRGAQFHAIYHQAGRAPRGWAEEGGPE